MGPAEVVEVLPLLEPLVGGRCRRSQRLLRVGRTPHRRSGGISRPPWWATGLSSRVDPFQGIRSDSIDELYSFTEIKSINFITT